MLRQLDYWLDYMALWLEAANHWADAYLARQRGDELFATDCDCRRYKVEGKMTRLSINRIFN